jgi:methylated-DNA-[protein]-cysteine S-methyltransferase
LIRVINSGAVAGKEGVIMEHKRISYTYDIIPSTLGEIGLVRRVDGRRSPVCRILLPEAGRPMTVIIRDLFPDAIPGRRKQDEFCKQIRDFLAGNAVDFRLENLDFGIVKGFARRVLLADGEIPRGRVMTYGCLAASVGVTGGARAVGNVMAGNPFPLVIPCHRVVRSGGSLGGFGGGAEMKKALLMMENVAFDAKGCVLPKHLFEKC